VDKINAAFSNPKLIKGLVDLVMTPRPLFRFMHYGWGRCRVPGCRRFVGRNRRGRLRRICLKHQGSPKFQRFAE